MAKEAIPLEAQVDRLEEKLRSRHMKRLTNEECNPYAGIIYLDMVSNVERISDHADNIAQILLDEERTFFSDDNDQS